MLLSYSGGCGRARRGRCEPVASGPDQSPLVVFRVQVSLLFSLFSLPPQQGNLSLIKICLICRFPSKVNNLIPWFLSFFLPISTTTTNPPQVRSNHETPRSDELWASPGQTSPWPWWPCCANINQAPPNTRASHLSWNHLDAQKHLEFFGKGGGVSAGGRGSIHKSPFYPPCRENSQWWKSLCLRRGLPTPWLVDSLAEAWESAFLSSNSSSPIKQLMTVGTLFNSSGLSYSFCKMGIIIGSPPHSIAERIRWGNIHKVLLSDRCFCWHSSPNIPLFSCSR